MAGCEIRARHTTMATLDRAATELANSLNLEEVPAKLRCAQCNKIAIDAVKLPCCDQSICEPCSKSLPDECPVCGHSPLASDECKPNKSLRMTVKAFLKNEEKKRSKDAGTQVVQSFESALSETPAPTQSANHAIEVGVTSIATNGGPGKTVEADTNGHEGAQVEMGATREIRPTERDVAGNVGAETAVEPDEADQDEDDEDDEDNIVITTERPEPVMQQQREVEQDMHADGDDYQGQHDHQAMQEQQQGYGGFDQNQQGGSFGGMNFNGMEGFNPMMAMQNGMGMPGFGGMGIPNMMGMPMDPSMMFGGGGAGGFGGGMGDMSAMMGMGMGPIGAFGGMPGMGMNGPGGFGGYNNQNFGNPMHQNFHNNRGYGRPYGRGYGRGRGYGYRGRGGYGYQNQNYGQQSFGQNQGYMNPMSQQQQQPQPQHYAGEESGVEEAGVERPSQGGRRGSPSYEPMKPVDDTTAVHNVQPDRTDADKQNGSTEDTNPAQRMTTNTAAEGEDRSKPHDENEELASQEVSAVIDNAPTQTNLNGEEDNAQAQGEMPQTADRNGSTTGRSAVHGAPQDQYHKDPFSQQNFAYSPRGRGGFRGRGAFRGRGGGFGYGGETTDLTPTPAPPANAPTGPKALREGKPNTGWYARSQPSTAPPATSPHPDVDRSKPLDRDERDRSKSRSRSRSKHRSRKHSHREDDSEYESEETYRRRKERERRKRKEKERRYDEEGNAEDEDGSRKGRSRGESREERDRDLDDDRRGSRSHRERSRERRKRRHRSRSPEKPVSVNGEHGREHRKDKSERKYHDEYDELERVREKDRSRKHSRREDNERDYESKDRSHRARHTRSNRDESKHRDREREKAAPIADDEVGFKIKGSKSASINPGGMAPPSRRGSVVLSRRHSILDSAPETPTTPALDPYAEERERRHQERMLKEQQRRQSTQSLGKRASRDDDDGHDGAPNGPKGDEGRGVGRKRKERRMNVKYEDELDGWR